MKNPTIIITRFLFEGGEIWDSMWDFERDMMEFLASKNKEARVIRNIRGAAEGEVFLMVKDMDKLNRMANPRPRIEKSIPPAQQIKNIQLRIPKQQK